MQPTDLEEIKAALFEQAYHPCTRVSWGMAQVIAARKSRGQLLVQLRGLSRWYPVEGMTIERAEAVPYWGVRHLRGRNRVNHMAGSSRRLPRRV